MTMRFIRFAAILLAMYGLLLALLYLTLAMLGREKIMAPVHLLATVLVTIDIKQ